MTGSSQLKRNNKPSIKYKHNPLKGVSFELSDFDHKDNPIIALGSDKSTPRNSEVKPSEILSTAELISTASYIWDCASRPLSILLPKTSSLCKSDACQGGHETYCCSNEATFSTSTSADDQYVAIKLSKADSAPAVSTNLECLSVTQRISCFEPNTERYSLLSILHDREKQLSGTRIERSLYSIYGWMGETALTTSPYLVMRPDRVNSVRIKYKGSSDSYVDDRSSCPANGCISAKTTGSNSLVIQISDGDVEVAQPVGSLLSEAIQESASEACEEIEKETKECHCEPQNNQEIKSVEVDSSGVELCLSAKKRPHYALAKQDHAFAGAMAGVFVSLCLHPVDTVKTILQSCRTDQKPLIDIGRSIISERGVMGLYRGISSNIASSAPISAVYAFTYESVKSALLPFFPKEYQSSVHCMAGGCASIATSFIFTPSERIKQQMQVGSHYRNCWNVFIEIIRRGGFSSLYAGWGAVLCRNIPHSVVKFYTYEKLKPLILPSDQSNIHVNTFATLVCGGIAGSTAALFSTPFDVVKTRYQTQIPGSVNQYDGVFDMLKEIAKREGLRGLYRGLTPRLAMYMTQGALFFASYESFKRLLSLHQNVEDNSLHSPVSVTA